MSFRSKLTRIPSCRPLSDRDVLFVQDFVRVISNDGGDASDRWFYTYSHSVEHPYFASRPGFVRANVKYQGLVGVLGDGGKTRLTWMVNFDFGGLVPSSFASSFLLFAMNYAYEVEEETKMYLEQQQGKVTGIAKPSPAQDRLSYEPVGVSSRDEALEELREKLKRSEKQVNALRDELVASLREKDRELDRALDEKHKELERALEKKDKELNQALAEKNEVLRMKDELLAEKDKQMMELRRRVPRVVEGEV